jgi:hypothetical protein
VITVLACCAALIAAPAPRAGASAAIVGGTTAQRQLARLTALRVGGLTLDRIVFHTPSELDVVSAKPSSVALTVRSGWEQRLYVGTYFALMARYPQAAVTRARTADSEIPADRVPAYDLWGALPRATAVADETRRLVEGAQARGARVLELRTAAIPARAIAITLKVTDPAAFLKHRAASFLQLLYKPRIRLLGFYVGLQDASGRLVWAMSRLPNEGSVFAIPRLDACSPVLHSEPVFSKQAPCPAR